MNEYIYKGFKISYRIVETVAQENLYKADGSVIYLLDPEKSLAPVKFHTEYDSYSGAEYEIKKLLENYIDFELKNFNEMKVEKIRSE